MGTKRALKLDADNNLVRVAGRLVIAEDGDSIVQAIRLSLSIFKAEWFLDENEGLPYWEEILVKNPNTAQIQRLFLDRISAIPGVDTVDSLVLDFDRVNRALTVTFKVSTDLTELPISGTLNLETPL